MAKPPSDPVFSLPMQTLLKLKPVRDMYYVRRSIPDLAQFRTAYHLLKAWAKERGVYSARFGYLGGIHLTVMLVRVCKLLMHDGGILSVPDLVVTFFNHYAKFDWNENMAFDPFFHKRLRYTRTFREPLVLLGWHAPALNTAATASLHTAKTIAAELKRVDSLMAGDSLQWAELIGAHITSLPSRSLTVGASDFLRRYKSYAKIEVQCWGQSLEKGSKFVGWLESRCVLVLVGTRKLYIS
jgi:poly(A) polymerase Pap1